MQVGNDGVSSTLTGLQYQTIAPDNVDLFYSPGNWSRSSTYARTTNIGAKLTFKVSTVASEPVGILINVSRMAHVPASRLPIVEWSVDGGERSTAQLPVSGSQSHELVLSDNLSEDTHLYEVWYKAVDQTMNTPDLWGATPPAS